MGDAFARAVLGGLVSIGLGWRGVFIVAACTLTIVAAIGLRVLKPTPEDLGLSLSWMESEEAAAARHSDVEMTAVDHPTPASITEDADLDDRSADRASGQGSGRSVLLTVLCMPEFYVVCALNMTTNFVREVFRDWAPVYLTEVVPVCCCGCGCFVAR